MSLLLENKNILQKTYIIFTHKPNLSFSYDRGHFQTDTEYQSAWIWTYTIQLNPDHWKLNVDFTKSQLICFLDEEDETKR